MEKHRIIKNRPVRFKDIKGFSTKTPIQMKPRVASWRKYEHVKPSGTAMVSFSIDTDFDGLMDIHMEVCFLTSEGKEHTQKWTCSLFSHVRNMLSVYFL